MELLQLHYFQTVARMENMTRAAQALHIAQPSLSKTIARLEEQVGVPLFDRRGKRICLNEYGACFLGHVEKALGQLEDGMAEVRDLAEQGERRVSVGSAVAKRLPTLLKAYLTERTDVKLRLLQVTHHGELLRKLEEGEIDLSISSLPLEGPGICCRELIQEPICLVVPRAHPFAARREIRFCEIGQEPLIYYTAECGLREILQTFCQEAGFVPNVTCECTTSEVTCSLVEAGVGLAFLPEYVSGMEYTKELTWVRVREPDLCRSIWVAWREDRYLSRTARDFLAFVMDYFSAENKN